MFAKKKFKKEDTWYTWINFPKFHELYHKYLETGQEFTVDDYLVRTPQTGLSGKGTADHFEENKAKHLLRKAKTAKENVFVDEKTDELEFYGEN